jgi:hypothetical protein
MHRLIQNRCSTLTSAYTPFTARQDLAVPPRAFFSLAPVGEQKRLRQFVRVCSPFYRCLQHPQRLCMQLFEGRPIEPTLPNIRPSSRARW